MCRVGVGSCREVGDGARDFEDALVGAHGEVELCGGAVEQGKRLGGGADVFGGVAECAVACALPGDLPFVGGACVCAVGGAVVLGGGGVAQLFGRDAVDGDVQVDAVEQGAGEFLAVAGDLVGGVGAGAVGVAVVAARAGVHGSNELEGGGVVAFHGGAREGDVAVFEGFAQHFEDAAVEFGQFVQKEDAVVGERDFAWFGDGAAADEGDGRAAVVRGAVGALHPVLRAEALLGEGEDGGAGDGFFAAHGRKDAGQALGKHGFAGAGRAAEQEVVAAGGGDEECPFCRFLADDVAQVGVVRRGGRGLRWRGWPRLSPKEDGGEFGEVVGAV